MKLPIVDAHIHVYDSTANVHRFLDEVDPTFEALVGDYSALPRRYLIDDYLAAARSCDVRGIVCHEYLSEDAVGEMRWLQRQADASPIPCSIVALVDFLDPQLEPRLEAYAALPAITAVRQHLGGDNDNPLKRFAARGDLLGDAAWQRGLTRLASKNYKCGLEVFAHQLPELLPVIRGNPDIGFTIAVLGWPLDLTRDGFERWRRDMRALSECDNICASISAIECLFGRDWTAETVRRWLLQAVELFGPDRCMLGSHMPITTLSRGFEPLYAAYREILSGFSADEQDKMFRGVAAQWFRLTPVMAKQVSDARAI
jgi:predicted TIM-barrel fold metal-dependent hydrolase